MTTMSFLIPTHSPDRPLAQCLDSVKDQLGKGDEVIVIGDTHDGDMPTVKALVKSYGSKFRYVAHDAGYHDWGHAQLNCGLSLAQGEYVHCNDDDDVYLPGAVAAMKAAAAEDPGRPLLFRFQSYVGPVFWVERGLFARNWIGGHCLVAPRLPGKVGRFASAYSGDFDYLESTIALHGGVESAVWKEEVICQARPS